MALRNTKEGWGLPARLLHWAIAGIISCPSEQENVRIHRVNGAIMARRSRICAAVICTPGPCPSTYGLNDRP